MERRIFKGLLCIFLLALFPLSANAAQEQSAEDRKLEIRTAWEKYKPVYEGSPYIEEPLLHNYTPGRLDPAYLADALNLVNYYRFLAGLPDDVEADGDMHLISQKGAVLLNANGKLEHTPDKPYDMTDEFYLSAYEATSGGNLAKCYGLTRSVELFAAEPGEHNTNVGHRRHLLSPSLKKTGFGFSNGYAVMYVKERADEAEYPDFYCWPNGPAFPQQSFPEYSYWSFHYNPELYAAAGPAVTITRQSDGAVWTLSEESGQLFSFSGGISFRPADISGEYSGVYTVFIEGIISKSDGKALPPIIYSVDFFDLFEDSSFESAEEVLSAVIHYDAPAINLQQDYSGGITRLDFATLLVSFEESRSGSISIADESPFSDTGDICARKAYAKGWIAGTREGEFSPDDSITRAQAAVIIYAYCGRPEYTGLDKYEDDSSIPSWAKDAVYYCRALGIIPDLQDGSFSPNSGLSLMDAMKILNVVFS